MANHKALPSLLNSKPLSEVKASSNDYFISLVVGENASSNMLSCLKAAAMRHGKVMAVADKKLTTCFPRLFENLKKTKIPHYLVPSGEANKNRKQKEALEDAMFSAKLDRQSALVIFGGGVVGDLASFAASTYMRGIDYYHYPTSLLAMVDSSIGGKTGVDIPRGKNLVGAIHQPLEVLIDLATLETLPDEEIQNGSAEILKYALAFDPELYEKLLDKKHLFTKRNNKLLKELVTTSAQQKAAIVSKDEREGSLRKTLNFGHTIGHAIEHLSDYKVKHGAAIALGMLIETLISFQKGVTNSETLEKVSKLLEDYQFATNFSSLAQLVERKTESRKKLLKKWTSSNIFRIASLDKKNKDKTVQMTYLMRIGKLSKSDGNYTDKVSEEMLKKALKALNARQSTPKL